MNAPARLEHKPGWKPARIQDAIREVMHELEVFERCVARGRIAREHLSHRRWLLHSAIHYLQAQADQLSALEAQGAANDAQGTAMTLPADYRMAVSATAFCRRSPEDAAAMFEDIARRLRAGQLFGDRDLGDAGDFRFSTLFAPGSARGASRPTPEDRND